MKLRIASLLLVAALALPTAALAADAEPQAIDDPPAAVVPAPAPANEAELAIDVAAPAAPAAAPAAAAAPAPHVTGSRAANPVVTRTRSAPSTAAPVGGGSLPFTGVDPRQLVFLFLVGSLLLAAGATAFAAAREPVRAD